MNYFTWQCYDCVSNLIWFPYFTPKKNNIAPQKNNKTPKNIIIIIFKPVFFPALVNSDKSVNSDKRVNSD